MPVIQKLTPQIANMIAAGEVVERPASVAKELLENAVDAGATKVTIEIRDGGMTFLRVTDNGCGMEAEDTKTAFLRHATSKLRQAEDLAAISTMGFRGEALAAIASVSRIDLLTKTADALAGTSLHIDAGKPEEPTEAGCPDGTTIIVRDLFFNTPARMKFMKSDPVEAGRITAAVQMQALAHPQVAFRLIRDGKRVLATPGSGSLQDVIYCIYGREFGETAEVNSHWDSFALTGFVTKPTSSRPSRNMQTFFVNNRPVKSRLLCTALEEAYRNRIMVGKFPGCVLHLTVPANMVDVNVHPAKTEIKFLREKDIFHCIHYGVLGVLNKTADRPDMQFNPRPGQEAPAEEVRKPQFSAEPAASGKAGQSPFFRTMNAQEFRSFSSALSHAPAPRPEAAAREAAKVENTVLPLREDRIVPRVSEPKTEPERPASISPVPATQEAVPSGSAEPASVPAAPAVQVPEEKAPEAPVSEQIGLSMPEVPDWRYIGELYYTYLIIEQGDNAFLIDKHAAHERILFDKLKAHPQEISGQTMLSPIACQMLPDSAAVLLENKALLQELGFEIEEFGSNTVLIRQIPMQLSPEDAKDTLLDLAADLLSGQAEKGDTLRDNMLHTVACKAAVKAGWHMDRQELLALAEEVMSREDLKYCPHGRPICITLSKKQLEKQFRRT